MLIDDAALVAGVSTVTGVLVKGIDIAYNYVKNRTVGDKVDRTLEDLVKSIQELTLLLQKTDSEGVPLVYLPRRLITQQEHTNAMLTQQTYSTEVLAKSLDKLATATENMNRAISRIEDRGHQNH